MAGEIGGNIFFGSDHFRVESAVGVEQSGWWACFFGALAAEGSGVYFRGFLVSAGEFLVRRVVLW